MGFDSVLVDGHSSPMLAYWDLPCYSFRPRTRKLGRERASLTPATGLSRLGDLQHPRTGIWSAGPHRAAAAGATSFTTSCRRSHCAF